jgi:hypothetical protein
MLDLFALVLASKSTWLLVWTGVMLLVFALPRLPAIDWDTRSLVRFLHPARGGLLHLACLYGSGASPNI